ncbi:DUF6950 family protein [Sphingomonas echinoides]|uniref:DUF6950 domain-containing protein n=1 Tax=Sphingomonas echinoides TaxID=59803 RepID=A0ABU4PKL0_9SPHN|nr:hypothetical protein [Sphingomonas echinoides]MDX5984701.1 hypothetical protein [Sphingomonas echinoides]
MFAAPEGMPPVSHSEHMLIRKRDAAQATLDRWSKRAHKLGTADCVRMAAAHLRSLGYTVKLPPSGSYRTVNSALKALKAAGHDSIPAALDAMGLERIAPAEAIVGDIIQMPAEHALGALVVVMGNGRVAGWHDDYADGVVVMQPLTPLAAWRVVPR